MTLSLRPYQRFAVDSVFHYWSEHDGSPLIVLPTGAGKSLVIAAFVQELLRDYCDMRILNVTHVKELLVQNYQELLSLWPFAPAGLFSAGLGRRDASQQIIFGGVQTIYNKARLIGHIDLVLIDEAHLVPRNAETQYGQLLADLRAINPDLKLVGLTATDYRLGEGKLTEGDGAMFDAVAYEKPVGELIDEGYLCRPISKATSTGYDLTGVKRVGGDYAKGELQAAVDRADVTVRAVDEIEAMGEMRRSWLIFCAGVQHAYHVRDELRTRGISAEAVAGETPAAERDRILADFKAGRVQAVCNNSVLCLDEETEILTREGWTGIDDMTPDHLIAAWNDDHTIEFTSPKLIVRRNRRHNEKMVSVAGRRSNLRVTANHRMIVAGRSNEPWSVRPAELIVGKQLFVPVSGVAHPCAVAPTCAAPTRERMRLRVNGNALNNRRRGMAPSEARAAAIEDTTRLAGLKPKQPTELTIADCHFIGFWLGDGTLSPRCEFSQSTAYPKIIDWFDGILKDCGFAHSRSLNSSPPKGQMPYVRWSVARGTGGGYQARDGGYYSVEPYLCKEGADFYWGLSEEQFAALMHGFWMADGNHRNGDDWKGAGKAIAGTQRKLYDLLQAIGACRGYRFTITDLPDRNPRHSHQWRMAWRKCARAQFVTDVPTIESDWKPERVWCVTSSTGRLITRRRGRVTVVGNTTGFNHPGVDLLAMLRPTLSASLYVQMTGRGLRNVYQLGAQLDTPEQRLAAIANGPKPNCLVLDFAGNVRRHGPIDAIRVRPPGKGEGDAPVKECPECHSLVHASKMVCDDCGYIFPPTDKPKHEAKADDAPVLSRTLAEWLPVRRRRMFRHDKPGKPSSVKVCFDTGLVEHKTWLCPGHEGFAKSKADRWWHEHGGARPFPRSADEWVAREGELRGTAEISVKPDGAYWTVVGMRPGEYAANDNVPSTANDNRPARWTADFAEDEIPF